MAFVLTGGCFCARIRYRLSRSPMDAGYCHCRLCQRSSGAPVLAWLTVAKSGFLYTRGKPHVFRSSTHGRREFCAVCGTQLMFRSVKAKTVDVTLASLDDPARVTPQFHIWRDSRIAWFDTDDDLPKYRKDEP